jgi:hypothetical protein
LTWRGPKGDGIAAHDDIFQSSVAVICGLGALGYAAKSTVKRHWQAVLMSTGVAAVFLSYFLFVSIFSRIVLGVAPVLTLLLGWRFGRLKGLLVAGLIAAAVSVAFWIVSPSLRERVHNSLDEFTEYSATNKATSIGQHLAFLTESLTIISSAPVIGHGTGAIANEYLKVTAGERGASAVPTINPHNQTFAVAIQLGLLGAVVLWSMWIAHLRLFRGRGAIGWIGTVIVIENIVSSTVHSHLFDAVHGWLYVFGVGVLGGMALRQRDGSFSAKRQS